MKRLILAATLLLSTSTPGYSADVVQNGKTIHVPFCGGIAGLTCEENEWCNFPDEQVCGIADYPGKCEPRPQACLKVYIPVCGCDGKSYGNSCEAHASGTDVAYQGPCSAHR